jgi:hypothetical protein
MFRRRETSATLHAKHCTTGEFRAALVTWKLYLTSVCQVFTAALSPDLQRCVLVGAECVFLFGHAP